MKTTLTLLVLSAIILLSSCESSNVLVLKRKYTKGYYVDLGNRKNNKNSEIKENKAIAPINSKESTEANLQADVMPEEIVNAPLLASVDGRIQLPPNNNKINLTHSRVSAEQKTSIENNDLQSEKAESKFISRIIKKIDKSKSTAQPRSDSDLVLLVILSLFPFLALLAMYLHDGRTVTLNFWIDLLLHFTVVGYAIFALLVVFDIINLA